MRHAIKPTPLNSMGCVVHRVGKESDMTEWLSLSLNLNYW